MDNGQTSVMALLNVELEKAEEEMQAQMQAFMDAVDAMRAATTETLRKAALERAVAAAAKRDAATQRARAIAEAMELAAQ